MDIVDIIKEDGRFGVVEGAEAVKEKMDELAAPYELSREELAIEVTRRLEIDKLVKMMEEMAECKN